MRIPFIRKRAKAKYPIRRPVTVNSPKSSVYTYRSSRSEVNRPHNRGDEPKEKKPLTARRSFRYIVLTAAILSAGYLLVLAPSAEVKSSGQALIPRPDKSYEESINQHLRHSILSYTKLTFDDQKLTSQIKSEFPEVAEADVAIPLFGRQPKIKIMFAKPSLLLRVFGDDTYLLDGQGRALVRQSEVSKSINTAELTTVNDTSNQKVELGKNFLTEQQIYFINEIVRQAQSKKLKVELINLAGGASQLNVKYKDVGYLVKYSFFADARQSSGSYFAIRERLSNDGKTPKQYVDLRIPDRAYIK